MTAEKFGQRVFELGLIDSKQLETVWSELATRDASLDDLIAAMVRRELITNFQADRILRGERTGFFYGKYKVLYLIGTGTFARVYRAVHTESGKVVAIKVLRKRYREDPIEYEQFLREGRMGSDLKHLNVVPIYEINGDPRAPYMVMEFVEGQTLKDMVRIRKKLDPLTSLKILADVLSGLAYAVDSGITHRDLKMSNVLISSSGRAKLVDFGLAAAKVDDEKLADCPNARAIDYAALERGTGVRKDDARSDLYFAGCLLYHMLSGRPPLFETKDRIRRLNITRFREITPIAQLEPTLPHGIVALLNRSMEMDPAKRFQSAHEMLREVQHLVQRFQTSGLPAPGQTDTAVASSDLADDSDAASPQDTPVIAHEEVTPLEGESRTLMIVESSVPMQNMLRDRLKKCGYRVLIISDPDRALWRFEDNPKVADCAIFCTTELETAAVEAFNKFGELSNEQRTPAILLLHQNQKPWLQAARQAPHRIALAAPKLGELRATLLRLLNHSGPNGD
jgi:eukaryotic-like serine/threonine-protein kinase